MARFFFLSEPQPDNAGEPPQGFYIPTQGNYHGGEEDALKRLYERLRGFCGFCVVSLSARFIVMGEIKIYHCIFLKLKPMKLNETF